MEETMKTNENKSRFLIDGFPPDNDNLQGWIELMDGRADVKFVLFFDCTIEVSHYLLDLLSYLVADFYKYFGCWLQVCIQRCLERGKSSGRDDDNKESLEKR